jgi:heme-degrading monooxygenase HmoA
MYTAIRKYYVIPGRGDELIQRVQGGFVPIISEVSGFVAYYLLEVRNDEIVSISIFDTRTGAEESTRRAATWVEKNIASLIQGLPEITVGAVKVCSTK